MFRESPSMFINHKHRTWHAEGPVLHPKKCYEGNHHNGLQQRKLQETAQSIMPIQDERKMRDRENKILIGLETARLFKRAEH
jgi:hypothetical protein